jgi:hypothetical protein
VIKDDLKTGGGGIGGFLPAKEEHGGSFRL